MKTLEEITAELNELTAEGQKALKTAEDDHSKVEEVQTFINDTLQPQVEILTREREEAIREVEYKALAQKFTTLEGVIADLRKPSGEFVLPTEDADGKALADEAYADPKHHVWQDIRLANRGDSDAKGRLTSGFEGLNAEGKAMTEGVDAQGGYLVRPVLERQLVLAKELDNVLRGLCSSINITTTGIQLDQLGISTSAGWVAELATKPESTAMTLATITANVFTAAGLVTVSNQLLADSNPSIDALVTSDIVKRLVALEETAFLNGSGTGQPLGILNTPGLPTTTVSTTDVPALVNGILTAIGAVETAHGSPTAILMHPRTWTKILIAQAGSGGPYLIGQSLQDVQPDFTSNRTINQGPRKSLWGYPVITSNRIPTNLGSGTNESRVIVADFKEALILDRQGITVDESEHVYFTTNQTVFRAEERVGFTAARTPGAWNIVGGAGFAAG